MPRSILRVKITPRIAAMGNQYSDLNCTFEIIKAEGDSVARFSGIASTSDIDQHNDIIEAGAFDPIPTKMAPDGQAIPDVMMLRDHDRSEIIGGWRSFKTEGRQLRVEGELALEVAKARETHALMKRGYLSGLSVGFAIRNMKDIDYDQNSGRRTIKKALLRECSIVGFPANNRARVLNVKSLLDDLLIEGKLDATDLLLALLGKQGNGKAAPDVKANEGKESYMSRCLETTGGNMKACTTKWDSHQKDDETKGALDRMRDLIKGIDGHTPIDERRLENELQGLLIKVKGYRHV